MNVDSKTEEAAVLQSGFNMVNRNNPTPKKHAVVNGFTYLQLSNYSIGCSPVREGTCEGPPRTVLKRSFYLSSFSSLHCRTRERYRRSSQFRSVSRI